MYAVAKNGDCMVQYNKILILEIVAYCLFLIDKSKVIIIVLNQSLLKLGKAPLRRIIQCRATFTLGKSLKEGYAEP